MATMKRTPKTEPAAAKVSERIAVAPPPALVASSVSICRLGSSAAAVSSMDVSLTAADMDIGTEELINGTGLLYLIINIII